jgi:hypothetical protein
VLGLVILLVRARGRVGRVVRDWIGEVKKSGIPWLRVR